MRTAKGAGARLGLRGCRSGASVVAVGLRGPLWAASAADCLGRLCGCGMARRNEDHDGHSLSTSTVRGSAALRSGILRTLLTCANADSLGSWGAHGARDLDRPEASRCSSTARSALGGRRPGILRHQHGEDDCCYGDSHGVLAGVTLPGRRRQSGSRNCGGQFRKRGGPVLEKRKKRSGIAERCSNRACEAACHAARCARPALLRRALRL